MNQSSWAPSNWRTEVWWSLGLLVVAIALYSLNLGGLPLRDWDEGTYATVARAMYRSGDWLYPTINGSPYLNKPPLLEWLIASSYTLAGVSELTTRLPAALLSASSIPLLYLVGRQVFPQHLPALFSALVYLTLIPVVRHGRLAMRDGIVVTFLLLLLLCLLKARRDRRWALGVGIAFGLMGLTKAILALLLGAIALFFLALEGQLPLLTSSYLWSGMALGCAPVIVWYGAQWHHYGIEFFQVHLLSQSFSRVWRSVDNNTGPPWYYLLELLKYTAPWLLFLPNGLFLAWQKRHQTWSHLALVGIVVYLGLISLMSTKLPWYIMPIYPFLALVIGAQLDQFWQRGPYPRAIAILFSVLALVSLVGGAYLSWSDSQPVLLPMGITLAITLGWTAWWMLQKNRRFVIVLISGCYLVLTIFMGSRLWIWELNEAFSVKPVATLIQTQTPPSTPVYMAFPYSRPSLNFYSDRPVIPASPPELQQAWTNGAYLLLDNVTLTALQLPAPQQLGTAEGFILVAPETTAS